MIYTQNGWNYQIVSNRKWFGTRQLPTALNSVPNSIFSFDKTKRVPRSETKIWVTRGITKYKQNGWTYSIVSTQKNLKARQPPTAFNTILIWYSLGKKTKKLATINITWHMLYIMLYFSNKGNNQMHSKWTNLLDCFNKRVFRMPESNQQHCTKPQIWSSALNNDLSSEQHNIWVICGIQVLQIEWHNNK